MEKETKKKYLDYLAGNGFLQVSAGFMAVGDDGWFNLDTHVLLTVSPTGVSTYRNRPDEGWRRTGEVGFPSGAMGGSLAAFK